VGAGALPVQRLPDRRAGKRRPSHGQDARVHPAVRGGGFLIPQSATCADLGPPARETREGRRGGELADEGLEIAKAQTPLAVPMVKVSKAEIALLEGSIDEAEALVGDADVSRLPGPIRGPRAPASISCADSSRGHGATTPESSRSPTRSSRGRSGSTCVSSSRRLSSSRDGCTSRPGGRRRPNRFSGSAQARRGHGLPPRALGDRRGAERDRRRARRRDGGRRAARRGCRRHMRYRGDDRRAGLRSSFLSLPKVRAVLDSA
jgi:hypothetical protein